MAEGKMTVSLKLVIFFVLICVLLIHTIECRGGRGGGSRGGGSRGGSTGRGSRSSRTSRSGSSISRTKTRYYRGPSYSKGSWKTAAAVGVVFGLASYKTRQMYRSYPNREPAICFNEKNLKNGTAYFVCPQRHDPDDMAACCGGADEKHCCEKTSMSAGTTAGIVIAVIAVIAIIVGCCCWSKFKKRKREKSGHVITTKSEAEQVPLNTSTGYQPGNTTEPVSWNTPNDGSLPYSANPDPPAYGYQPPPQPGLNPEPYPPAQPFAPPAQPFVQPAQPFVQPQPFVAPQPYDPPQPFAGIQQPGPVPMGFDEANKGPIPEGDVSGGLPYPTNPAMNYPPPSQGYPNAPPPPYPQ